MRLGHCKMQAVYYFYKESRKGAFLEEMLQGFSGVVVSDFFTAYDTLKCPQQKCVIHLLRDINEDLMKSPFDQELRNVVQPFATLLRTIIETVDNYGLNRSTYTNTGGRLMNFSNRFEK